MTIIKHTHLAETKTHGSRANVPFSRKFFHAPRRRLSLTAEIPGCQERNMTSAWLYIWCPDALGKKRHFLFALISHVKIVISHVGAKILIWPVRKRLWACRPLRAQSGAVDIPVTSRCDYYIFSEPSFGTRCLSASLSISVCWDGMWRGGKFL